MPYLFKQPEQGDQLRNTVTGEVYTITDTILNPRTNLWEGLIRIDSNIPPNKNLSEKLEFVDQDVRVRFTAEFPRSLGIEKQTEDELIKDVGPIRPTIVYSLIRKEPGSIGKRPFAPQKQRKPAVRERIRNNRTGQIFDVWAQWFDYLVEFTCFATDNYVADLLADWLEDFVRQYTWVLKLNGVAEILFERRLRDTAVTKWRQDLISRTVQYYFRLEDLLPEPQKALTSVPIDLQVSNKIEDPADTRYIAGHLETGHLSDQDYRALFRDPSGNYLFGNLVLNDGNL
jgi:hypothetical protein